MFFKTIILILPALACANINVRIRAGNTQQDSQVEAFGERIDIISDVERGTFQLSDGHLKDAVGKLAGRRPDDAYVHSPTPWNDLYRTYNWGEVRTKLVPVSWRVLSLRKNPVIVAKKSFVNKSQFTAKYNGAISQQVWKTVSSTWSKGGDITVGQDVSYNVNFVAGSVGGTTSFGFNSNWGESSTKSQQTVLSSGSSVEVELRPGQTAYAVLSASRGELEVEVEYEATLSGSVACNYGSPHNGHHFWSYDINAVLQAAGRNTNVRSKEVIRIGFYSDEDVRVYDSASGQKLR